MEYPILPTLKEFEDYSGDKLDSRLSGDIQNITTRAEILFKRAYRAILKELPNIQITDLDSDDESNWKILIMEQTEYFLSIGDRSLTGEDVSELSPSIPTMAKEFYLWTRRF